MGKKDAGFDDGFSEMIVEPPSAGIGHNKGPEWLPVGNELETKLLQAHDKTLKRAQELRSKVGAFRKVDTQADLKRITEYVRQLQAAISDLDNSAQLEKSPYRTALGQIAGVLGEPEDALTAIKKSSEAMMTSYNAKVLREARAKAAEESAARQRELDAARRIKAAADKAATEAAAAAQKKIDDAARAAAEAKKPPKSPPKAVIRAIEKADNAQRAADAARDVVDDTAADATRAERATRATASDITRQRSPNAVQSGQEFVDFRDLKRADIDLETLRPFLAIADIEKALRAYISPRSEELKRTVRQGKQPLKGVELWINLRTRVGG